MAVAEQPGASTLWNAVAAQAGERIALSCPDDGRNWSFDQLLAAAGYAASDTGMQSWLDRKGCHSDHWDALLSLAKSAREINRTNGLLINKHMTRNQQALDVLQGTAPSSNFYGPNGQATSQVSTRRRLLAK